MTTCFSKMQAVHSLEREKQAGTTSPNGGAGRAAWAVPMSLDFDSEGLETVFLLGEQSFLSDFVNTRQR